MNMLKRLLSMRILAWLALLPLPAFADAPATPLPPSIQSKLMQFGPIVLLAVVFYFLILRPNSKRAKEQRNLMANLKPGDRILTSSGIIGFIKRMDGEIVLIETGEHTTLTLRKSTITQILPNDPSSDASRD